MEYLDSIYKTLKKNAFMMFADHVTMTLFYLSYHFSAYCCHILMGNNR